MNFCCLVRYVRCIPSSEGLLIDATSLLTFRSALCGIDWITATTTNTQKQEHKYFNRNARSFSSKKLTTPSITISPASTKGRFRVRAKPLKEVNKQRPKSVLADQVDPISNRQEGIMLSGLSKEFCDSPKLICSAFAQSGVTNITEDLVLNMKTRNGLFTGITIVLTPQPFPKSLLSVFPSGTLATLMDRHDISMFVERCERLLTLSDDIRWLAKPEHFDRTVTITEVPISYGRRELKDVLKRYAHVDVTPTDIVFQFDAHGQQTDMAWVVCPTAQEASKVLQMLQELPVPQRVQYASLFGCAFLWSYRSSLFISHEDLDFQTHRSRSQVFLHGWESLSSCEDFETLLMQLNLSPTSIKRVYNKANETVSFFIEFDTMKEARNSMVIFHKLKSEWRLGDVEILYAYPRLANVRWLDDTHPPDVDEEGDSDIEDPIEA